MGRAKVTNTEPLDRRPALSIEARETEMIALAVNLAEKQLRDGTASSQVITHYLKMGSTKERIEKEILARQKELIEAKTDSIKATKKADELYEKALSAFRSYQGASEEEIIDEDLF